MTSSSTTDENGRAQSTWHLDATPGTYTATAKVKGKTLSTNFEVTVSGEAAACNNPLVLTDDSEGADHWTSIVTAGPFLAHGIDNWRVEICRVAAGPALPR